MPVIHRRPSRLFAITLIAALPVVAQAQRTDEDTGNVYMTGPEVRPPGPINGGLLILLTLITGLGAMVLQAFSNYAERA